jgi:hypothetical protein
VPPHDLRQPPPEVKGSAIFINGHAVRQRGKREAPVGHQERAGEAAALQRRLDRVQGGGDAGSGHRPFDGAVAEAAQKNDQPPACR